MDEIDDQLIRFVDSGITKYTSLSKKLDMPLSTIHVRMKKLEQSGTIRFYKGEIDWKKAGLSLSALILINIDVNLLQKMKRSQDDLLNELLELRYVSEGYVITGDADILIKVRARDSAHFKEILLNDIDSKEGIVKTKTMIILE